MAFFLNSDDTIAALATPPGIGAIAIIRISGKNSFAIADSIFKSKKDGLKLADCKSHTIHFGTIVDADTVFDEVLVSLFKLRIRLQEKIQLKFPVTVRCLSNNKY